MNELLNEGFIHEEKLNQVSLLVSCQKVIMNQYRSLFDGILLI